MFRNLSSIVKIKLIAVIFLLILLVVVNFESIAEYFFSSELLNPKGELLKFFFQVIGGLILLFSGFIAYQKLITLQKNHLLSKKADLNLRFNKAVDNLNLSDEILSLGGVYTLNEIAKDYIEYREIVFKILNNYINEKTKNLPSFYELSSIEQEIVEPTIVVTEIIKVLFYNDINNIYNKFRPYFKRAKLNGVDFSNCALRGATFLNCECVKSNFNKSTLSASKIIGSDFSASNMDATAWVFAFIDNSNFKCCSFVTSNFSFAVLQEVNFSFSLMMPEFLMADLRKCILDGCQIFPYKKSFTASGLSISVKGCKNSGIDFSLASIGIMGITNITRRKLLDYLSEKPREINIFDSGVNIEEERKHLIVKYSLEYNKATFRKTFGALHSKFKQDSFKFYDHGGLTEDEKDKIYERFLNYKMKMLDYGIEINQK